MPARKFYAHLLEPSDVRRTALILGESSAFAKALEAGNLMQGPVVFLRILDDVLVVDRDHLSELLGKWNACLVCSQEQAARLC